KWWSELPSPPRDEDKTLNEVAPRLRLLLSQEVLPTLSEEQLVELLGGIHASVEFARRVKNHLVGLADGSYTIPDKVRALARKLASGADGIDIPLIRTLQFVLYGGDVDEVPQRLWQAANDPEHKV